MTRPAVTETYTPQNFSEVISYTGTSPEECTITIANLTELDNASWRVRVDAEMETTNFVRNNIIQSKIKIDVEYSVQMLFLARLSIF